MVSRGVFALVIKGGNLLLSERKDGRGWNLPGGHTEEGETDQEALMREVEEETGLKVEVIRPVNTYKLFSGDISVAYECKVISGLLLQETAETKTNRYVTEHELEQGYYIGPNGRTSIKLIKSSGRMGRMARMVRDGFSLIEKGG